MARDIGFPNRNVKQGNAFLWPAARDASAGDGKVFVDPHATV